MRGTFATHSPTPQKFEGRPGEDHAEETTAEEGTEDQEASPSSEEEGTEKVVVPSLSSL